MQSMQQKPQSIMCVPQGFKPKPTNIVSLLQKITQKTHSLLDQILLSVKLQIFGKKPSSSFNYYKRTN